MGAQKRERPCIFCQIPKENRERVAWENDYFWAMFDACPVSPGHLLLIPKRCVLNFLDLNQEERKSFFDSLEEVMKLASETDLRMVYTSILENPPSETSPSFCQKALEHPRLGTKPDAFNIGVNDGRAAGRTVDHLHIHIIPRFKGDLDDPTGGVRFVIPSRGNYRKRL